MATHKVEFYLETRFVLTSDDKPALRKVFERDVGTVGTAVPAIGRIPESKQDVKTTAAHYNVTVGWSASRAIKKIPREKATFLRYLLL